MDVLYLLGSGSTWDNNELRYSLRSLEKFGKGVSRVFVVGDDPGFLSSEVYYIPCDDPGHRAYNHAYKVLKTIHTTDISENFLLNYDDNFFIKPTDITKIPFYYKYPVLKTRFNTMTDYKKSIVNTRRFLESMHAPVKDFSVHCPIIYNRTSFTKFSKIWNICKDPEKAFLIRSVYCNLLRIEGVYSPDFKIKNGIKNRKDVETQVRNWNFFSIHDRTIHLGVSDFLSEMFPKRSRYEKS